VGHGGVHLVDDVEDVPHGERVTNLIHGFDIESGRHFICLFLVGNWCHLGLFIKILESIHTHVELEFVPMTCRETLDVGLQVACKLLIFVDYTIRGQ